MNPNNLVLLVGLVFVIGLIVIVAIPYFVFRKPKQLDMKTYMERMHKEREDLIDLQHQLEIKAHQDNK